MAKFSMKRGGKEVGDAADAGETLAFVHAGNEAAAATALAQVEAAMRVGGATEVVGVPTSLDTHIAAHEVYLRPLGVEDTEIALSLGDIQQVELL